jgi:hypothetical protein
MELINVWSQWKRLGPPFGGGWAEWPARLVDVLSALESEYNALTEAERKWKETQNA